MTLDILPVYIGYDKREHEAYEVCRHSLQRHSSIPLHIQPLDQNALRYSGLYRRASSPGTWEDSSDHKPFSTDFSFSRFLVPALQQWKGWALFVDCDFVFTQDIAKLFYGVDREMAVSVVQHDYRPKETLKMADQPQENYDRKNWSSLIMWYCGHPSNKKLTVDAVNLEPGSWLHGFRWLKDEEIGSIDKDWNWLEGWYPSKDPPPAAIHYTRGGPWFANWQSVDFADLYLAERKLVPNLKGIQNGS